MSYAQVFGGSTIYPGDVSLLALALSASVALDWPLESAATETPAARIIDVTAAGAFTVTLPDATKASPGQTILFNNLPASAASFFVVDAEGVAVATVPVGTQWQVYLAGNADEGGTWHAYQLGASTATVQPSALAGYGIAAIAGQLSQSTPVTTFNASPRTALLTDRASALVWNGGGAATLNLPGVVAAGNNYFLAVRNSGGGLLTIDPLGAEVIDGASALRLNPGESTTVMTDGVSWYSLGLGRDAVFAFDYTVIDLTGDSTPYTLSGSELNRTAYKFIGTLTHDVEIIVPPTIQQYWVDNSTTGAFALNINTAGGSPVEAEQDARVILYCNGAEVISADTGGVSLPISANQGGTGHTSYTIGDILYAAGVTTLSRLASVATGNVLLAGGVGVAPLWGKVGLGTHVSGTLPVANGGTGAATFTANRLLKGNGTGAIAVSNITDDGTNVSMTAASLTVDSGANANGNVRVKNTGANWSMGMLSTPGHTRWSLYQNAAGLEPISVLLNGNVGIATAAPSVPFEVTGASKFTGNLALQGSLTVKDSVAAGYITTVLENSNATGFNQLIFNVGSNGGGGQARIAYVPGAAFAIGPNANDTITPVTFVTNNGTERMRIAQNGQVSIGTTASNVFSLGYSRVLDLSTPAGTAALEINSGPGSYAALDLGINSARAASVDCSGDQLRLSAIGARPILALTNGNERWRTQSNGRTLFNTASEFSGTNGQVQIVGGTETALSLYVPSTSPQTVVDIYNPSGAGRVGWIGTNGTTTSYNTTSDARLKINIVDAGGAGAVIDAIRVRSFNWKTSGEQVRFGVIAQELHQCFPEAVHVGSEVDPETGEVLDPWGVDRSELMMLAIKELQSLRARVAELEAKVA